MNNTDIVTTLNYISTRLNEILPVIFLAIGTFGHTCNVIIFSQRSQRTNPIAIYFLSSTIANFFVLYLGMLPKYIQDVFEIDWMNKNLVLCRIRSFFFNLSLSLFNWYILLATIDRYLISSNNNYRRRLSTLKNAYRMIGILIILFILCYCHTLILYNIQIYGNSFNRSQYYCLPMRGTYRLLCDIQLLIQFSLLPPILMSIFVILTIRNIRLAHRRIVNSIVANQHARLRKRDLQMIQMLLVQVCITIICSLPLAVSQLLTTMTSTWSSKTLLRNAIENLLSQIGRNLAFFNSSVSFYLYTLTGSQFRRDIRRSIDRSTMFICHKRFFGNNPNLSNPNAPIPMVQLDQIDINKTE